MPQGKRITAMFTSESGFSIHRFESIKDGIRAFEAFAKEDEYRLAFIKYGHISDDKMRRCPRYDEEWAMPDIGSYATKVRRIKLA